MIPLSKKLIDNLYGFVDVFRYSRLHLLHRQNVAEHSYNVAVMTLDLLEQCDTATLQEKYDILAAALLHDFEELYTGDIISPIKNKIDNMEEIEDNAVRQVLPDHLIKYWLMSREEHCSVIKVVDLLERIEFCKKEKEVGNTESYLDFIISESEKRIKELCT